MILGQSREEEEKEAGQSLAYFTKPWEIEFSKDK